MGNGVADYMCVDGIGDSVVDVGSVGVVLYEFEKGKGISVEKYKGDKVDRNNDDSDVIDGRCEHFYREKDGVGFVDRNRVGARCEVVDPLYENYIRIGGGIFGRDILYRI